MYYRYLTIFLFLFWGFCASLSAQIVVEEGEEKIKLEKAEILEKVPENPTVKKLKERVMIRHKGTVLYCDSAHLHESKNAVDAYGNVRLVGENGVRLNSKNLYYDGEKQVASAVGDVVLIDEDMRLTTDELDYNIAQKVAFYSMGGRIVDSEKTLESQQGSYDTQSKTFYFKQDVELITKKDGKKVNTNYLVYNTVSKIAFLQGPTTIKSRNGTVYTENGTLNTETEASNFKGRSSVDNPKYYLEGDDLSFNNKQEIGYAKGNVLMFVKKDSILINGDVGRLWGKEGRTLVYGNALMRNITKNDTLYVRADTLLSINREEENDTLKVLLAYPNARVYGKDLQARCDSLTYNRGDSSIYFFGDPVIWNNRSQLSADSIRIQMANQKLHKMTMKVNAFAISEDTVKHYNQLKGKNMYAYFKENQIRRLEVRGNSQNIYFALEDEDTTLIAMNRIECSDMNISFLADNKIHRVTYLTEVDGNFVPPHEIQSPQTRLKNFRWRIDERPILENMRPQAAQANAPGLLPELPEELEVETELSPEDPEPKRLPLEIPSQKVLPQKIKTDKAPEKP